MPIPKLKLSQWMMKLAGHFIDYQAESAPLDSRIIEYGFALSKLFGLPKGKMLDVGCVARHNYLIPALCFANWQVYGIDIRDNWGFKHPNFTFVKEDIRHSQFKDAEFDLVSCISTLEHIGLANYYGITEQDEAGDLKAAKEMVRILKPSGILLLTVPYCKARFIRPGARVYGPEIVSMFLHLKILGLVIYVESKDGWIPANGEIDKEGVICLALQK